MRNCRKRRDEGMALLVSMIFLIVFGMIVTFAATRVINKRNQVTNYIDFQNSFEGVEAGLGRAKMEIRTLGDPGDDGFPNDGFVGVNPAFDLTTGVPTWNSVQVTPLSVPMMQEVQYFAYSYDWANDGIDNNGDGQIDLGPETLNYHSTYSLARVVRNGAVSTTRGAEEVVQAINVNVWQNAIFAGNGQAGALINGNVSIHGSVHLLGDALGAGGVALAALDLSGTSLIHNNYEGLSADLRGRVPPLPQTMHNGEMVDTLFAALRVKNGLVGMSGNSEVGEPHIQGNSYKETMDNVFVTDGWTGTDVDVNGDPQSVHSDNGWDNGYDLGSAVPFPTYDDDGGQSHIDYFLETDPNPGEGFQFVYPGDLTMQVSGDNVYWNASTGTATIGGTPGDGTMPLQGDLDPDEFYVWFDASTGDMLINGRIAAEGNISLLPGNGANNKTINYEGQGSFLAYDSAVADGGDVYVDANLKTTDFPNTNSIGLHSQDDMVLGTDAQMEMMGGFYAQDTVSVDRQTTIMGTIVGEFFDMGGQVPDIYYVPGLSQAWTDDMRMIGANPVWFLQTVSWRELGVR